jgi:transcription termination factor Rho
MRPPRHNRHRSDHPHAPHRHRQHGPQRPSQGQPPPGRPHPAAVRQADESERRFLAGTAVDPWPRIRLEDGSKELTMRAMDLLTPIGMGQRGLIVAPPGSGKTTFLKHICQAVAKCHPEVRLYCLLVDERPEEVTDFRRSVSAEVHSSSSDESYEHHVQIADTLMRQVYREVADGANVVCVIDSLTRLARVHNAELRSSGRTLSGGVDVRAMEVPRRIFGAARKIENGGSLTLLATILVETGSRMDEVIFEEFKGTGNMEIVLSREISGRRIYPAIHIARSATRKEERLFEAEELGQIQRLRRALASLSPVEAAAALVEQLQKFTTNRELLATLCAKS